MKYVFAVLFALLVAASIITASMMPEARTDVPVFYWVTDPNPARIEQIEIFHRWMQRHNYPACELRLDTANRDVSKMVIQGVSGVGGDVMDIGSGGGMRYFNSVGLLEDVSADAEKLGFDASHTYPAMESEITLDGKQYMFPCNVYVHMYWINKATFRRHRQPLPPSRWDFETFERMGKSFVATANKPGERRTVFYVNQLPAGTMRRSLGLSTFNETLTRCTLDDPRNVQSLKLLHKWTYDDHILPSAADRESFSTASGYGGATLQLFNNGNYAMFMMGRYALIQLREFGSLELAVTEPPHGGFRNTSTGTRAGAVYIGSRHKQLAKYFLGYLASEDYNMQIVRDADALPPNPVYTEIEQFNRPRDYPNEWDCHKPFADAAKNIAIGGAYSPFVVPNTVSRIDSETTEGFMSGLYEADHAARMAAEMVNEEIQRNLQEDPKLQPLYDELVTRQKKIDRLRAAGQPVPLDMIENPFHRRYYAYKGWTE